ncbi:sporulation histidine kinase inhibitor Sda [Metabacillus litoralis]|uniref:sporulation histidine kinase inhibitor Sda n=1 Tax=Metabacillus litoralis TaxID=152268 RepID=UPI00203BB467|nr:sporulation histidine kinase inhibitor Sda [Metabacillus litoralis]MCM3160783.1 sporulation histidine kinase inhibitor Sda [Metabacillus litoralis]
MIQKLNDKDLLNAYTKAIRLVDIDHYFVYLLEEEVKRRNNLNQGFILFIYERGKK